MGLWSKIKKGVKKAAKAVKKAAEAVKEAASAVGDAIGGAIEAAGNKIEDAVNWIGDKVGGKPFFRWLGGVIKSGFAIAGAVVKSVFDIVGGVISGAMKIAAGIFSLDGRMILDGLLDIVSPVAGAIIVIGGKIIAAIQTVFYLQDFERKLTKDEEAQVRRVFMDSLEYDVIRLITGHSGIYGINSDPFVLGNTIYMKKASFALDDLVHECTHVWQYQNRGVRYSSDAVGAQWFAPGDAYDWEREILVGNRKEWEEMNGEAEAEFLEDVWNDGELRDHAGVVLDSGPGAFYDADWKKRLGFFRNPDYTEFGRKAVKVVRDA